MSVTRLLGYAALHLLPSFALERWLRHRLSVPGYFFSGRFSGRTALVELASTLRKEARAPIALYPDYICNIVPRALAEAGWKVEPYPTDQGLEGDWTTLLTRMKNGGVGLLIGASVFGSSGLLDELADPQKLDQLRQLGVKIIIDLAQDIRLIHKLPQHGSDLVASIVSFNDKSFPGAMGGGILAGQPYQAVQLKPKLRDRAKLYYRVLYSEFSRIVRRPPVRKSKAEGFDYSQCSVFPFKLTDAYCLTKLQLICAVQGLFLLNRYGAAKAHLLERRAHLETRFADTASYLIMLDNGDEVGRKKKRPYAIEEQPENSRRPDDLILHNKGFNDHA